MDGLLLTPLKRIPTAGGDVLHGMKEGDPGYAGFGEAYFSLVRPGVIKGWKRHRRMTLNLIVTQGRIRFVVCDDRKGAPRFEETLLSPDSAETCCRLTVAPGLWMAFRGEGESVNMLLNIASLRHDPDEAENALLETFPFRWP
jgi:dTDP-4-dehydrorhamnose 3,5-epimerase